MGCFGVAFAVCSGGYLWLVASLVDFLVLVWWGCVGFLNFGVICFLGYWLPVSGLWLWLVFVVDMVGWIGF